MDVPEKQKDSDSRRLSLIDFSGEDDCLFNSPIMNSANPKYSDKGNEEERFQMSGFAHSSYDKKSADLLHEEEEVGEPAEFLNPGKGRKNEKYNLRKSLAWDSAFFTSDGVLDPEELSCMIVGNEKREKNPLPGIEEDISVSCDSFTTLGSETLTLESLEADLFGDIRASIQKSSKASGNMNSCAKVESGVAEPKTQTASSSTKVESASQSKIKLKAAPKKPNAGMQASGKSLKQVSAQPQVSKLGAKTRESTSSLPKLAKVQTGIAPIPKTSSKKDSIGSNLVKMGKDLKAVRATMKTPAIVASRNTIPRTTQHSRSSSASTKAELTTSCSSLDSCGSASSSSLPKSPLNSMKRKSDLKIVKNSSSSSTVVNPLRPAARGKVQAGSSQISALLKSVTSLSSSISSTSSINASESLSPVSAVRQRSNSARSSIGTGCCKGVNKSGDGSQPVSSHGGPVKIASAGTAKLAQPDSMKPSGLRLPSPKLGFFDGMKSLGRSPNMLPRPGIPSGLPKSGAGTHSPSGSANRTIPGRPQVGRTLTANQSSKTDAKQASTGNPRSSPLKKSPNTVKKAPSSARRSSCHSPIISPLQNKPSPRRASSLSKDTGAGSNGKKDDSNFALAKKLKSVCLKDTKVTTSPSGRSQHTDHDGTDSSHQNTNEKEGAHQSIAPIDQVGEGANMETKKESVVNTEELVNGLSLLTLNSSLTPEVTAGTRIPLAAKECNVEAPVDISTGAAALQTEKIATLPTIENILPEST